MSVATIILGPLISGYIFALLFPPSRYHAAREEGHKLYFRAAFYGFSLSICTILLESIVSYSFPVAKNFSWNFCYYFVDSNFSDSYNKKETTNFIHLNVLCFATSLIIGTISNISNDFKFYCYKKAISNDDIEIIISRSIIKCMPIALTMKNRKVYVGFVCNSIDPKEERKDIRILPLLSGYREKDNLELIFTTNYENIYPQIDNHENGNLTHLDFEDFEIAFPVSEIQSYNLFDIDAYNQFNAEDESMNIEVGNQDSQLLISGQSAT